MKDLNKKIVSLLLSGALVGSMSGSTASASYERLEPDGYYITDESLYTKVYYINGVFTMLINGEPVYVYLDNNVSNKYLPKYDALFEGELIYDQVYLFSKTVVNPYYMEGVSSLSEKNITIYALSDKSYVFGWTRINKDKLGTNDMIATSIELGEFLLKNEEMSDYYFDMTGFAYADFNKDGKSDDILYIGNDKLNELFKNKEEAIKYAVSNYDNYYFVRKTVINPNYVRGVNTREVTIYALSDEAFVPGWARVNKKDVPNNAKIGSNPEYMLAITNISFKTIESEEIYNPSFPYSFKIKSEALAYAYQNYPEFCILTKIVTNPNDKSQNEILYSFSTSPNVEGWKIIANSMVPENAYILLSMDDAYNYEYQLTYSFTKTLK